MMKIPQYSLVILFISFVYVCSGQSKRNDHWFFGYRSGIDFSSGAPVVDTLGKLESIEGCGSVSDKMGNLLFYSNGEKVWGKNHIVMPNGNNLAGDQSSLQSILIAPSPSDSQQYCLFTTCLTSLRSNLIDMTLNGGKGDIVPGTKNTLISNVASEAIAGTYHCNGKDIWIITRGRGTNGEAFYVYLLDKSGLANLKVQTFKIPIPSYPSPDHLTFSRDGSTLAYTTHAANGKIYILDFNRYSGAITLKRTLTTSSQETMYSTAFSPDNSKLYLSSWGLNAKCYLSQFDLSVADPVSSRVNLSDIDFSNGSPNGYGFIGRLQLGPDGKIYVSRWHQKYPLLINPSSYYSLDSLDAIKEPNAAGINCDFVKNYLYLKGRPTMIGLPNFISDPMTQLPVVDLGNDTTFTCNVNLLLDSKTDSVSYLWNDLSTTKTRQVNDSGWHWVEVRKEGCPVRDSIYVGLLNINIGADTVICNSTINLILDAKIDSATYKWDDGSTGKTRQIHSLGTYWVEVLTQDNCVKTDTMVVSPPPVIDLGNDTMICSGNSIILRTNTPNATYAWQDGSTTPFFITSLAGKYKVTVKTAQCETSDSINISIQPKPILDLGHDSDYCFQQPVLLISNNIADTYLWQDGSSSNFYNATLPGIYWLETAINTCKARDTIILSQKPIPLVDLGPDKSVCKEEQLLLNAGNPNATIIWEDSSTGQTHLINAPGIFFVTVTNKENCIYTDSVIFDTFVSPTLDLVKDTFFCNGKILTLDAGPGFSSYKWQDTAIGQTFLVHSANVYYVVVSDNHNCTAIDTVSVYMRPNPEIQLPEKILTCEPSFYLTPGKFAHYLWQDGSVSSSYFVDHYDTLSVTVMDSSFCSNSKTISIVNDCPASIYMPNAFTPNHDQLNDSYKPTTRNIDALTFQVYNRWGELLFETTKIDEGWYDQEAIADVYFYIINYRGTNGETGTLKGNFTLLK